MANPVVLALMVWLVFIGVGLKHHGLKYFLDAINPPACRLALKFLVIVHRDDLGLPRPAVLAGHPALRQHAGGPHPARHVRRPHRVGVGALAALASIVPVTFLGLVLFTGFELLVAVLQAYVFTLLTAVYIGSSIHAH